ncbi:autotransporter beta-domain protein [Leptotrichia wadei]|uniref:Autotransporter beta-domain protein n=1 Tax=Leptotrichia wadei TaxID=157687 RepID=A0A133ZWY9_9FUSO|nr:autotransporter-associated N-terminal domain-containing protein [Leptotrichia wadei]KXB59940.1 autotransporter beta-domain protein [Leptotrichia wadei]
MKNNLRKISQELRAFAKRTKDFKYTNSALITFLMTGMLFASNNIFSENADTGIKNQVNQINTSINQIRTDFKRARKENNKLIKDTNLELTQLMEQGDHVTKSPWSSWQYGMNYFYNDWHGTFKGKGNKIDNVIYKRDQTLNKYIAKPISEGSANNTTTLGFAYEPNAAIPISASITPKSITKTNPNIQKNVAIASLPSFEPRTVNDPLEPAAPKVPDINIPTFNVNVTSNGNSESNVADGDGSNSTIQQVIINSGNFFVSRTGDNWNYHYDSYSGKSMWNNANTDNPAYSASSNWSGWSRGNTSRSNKRGFQAVVGSTGSGSTMISNGKFIYTRNETGSSRLGEFVHLDVHGASPILSTSDLSTATSGLGSQATDVQTAYNDAATITGATSTPATHMHTWINSGKIILEGSDVSLTNTYTHNGDNTWKQASINTGTVIFQPSINNSTVYNSTTAGFVISNDSRYYTSGDVGSKTNHNVLYNSGTIKSYNQGNAMFVTDSEAVKPVTIVNKGTLESYGESSAGVYIKRKANIYFEFDKPIALYGDKSIGFYNLGESNDATLNTYKAAEGNLKIDIGATGKGNENFTATSYSGYETQGTNVSAYSSTGIDVNPNDTVMIAGVPVENRNIQSSFGILSNEPINLTSHQIRIYDKTEGNVGVMPHKNVLLKLGDGKIELNGGKENIGIYVTNNYTNGATPVITQGAVKSTGDVNLNGGKGNLAIYAKGSNHPSGVLETVSVRKVTSNNTENSVAIFASDDQNLGVNGSVVKVTGGMEVKNATVSANPTIAGKENAGAVYATGKNTSVTIDMPAISPATTPATPTTPNIEVKGKEIVTIDPVTGAITGTGNYTGFGLYAGKGAQISAKYNNIKVEDGGTAVASVGNDGTNASNIDLSGTATNPGSTVEYKGKGYALFSKDGGKIDLSYGTLTLRGEATGYSRDVTAATPSITLTDTKLNVFSNDVIVANLTGVTTFNTNNSYINGNPSNTIGTYIPITKITNTEGGTTYNGYKYTVFDGIDVNVDSNIDKADTTGAGGTTPSDSYIFTRRLQLQNSRINVLSGNTVKAHLNTTEINDINPKLTVPVGLDISASGNSKNNTTTAINVQNGATISVDRTDSGNGGVGAYVNYGKVHNEGKIEVEKPTPNDHAVGIYATNGTEVNNDTTGTVDVGGKDSIGILGLSYRIDSKNNVVYEKFGTTGPSVFSNKLGTVDITNSGKITLDGDNSLGIYAKNNSLNATGTNMDYAKIGNAYTQATNKGEITMSGKNAIGMITEGGVLTNDTAGKITISGQEGVAMYGTYGSIDPAIVAAQGLTTDRLSAALVNKGTLELADTTGTTPIIGMFTNDADTEIETSGTLNIGKKSYGIYGVSNSVTMSGGTINVGEDGVGIFATGSSDKRLTSGSDVVLQGGTINVGDNQAVGVFIADDATNPLKTTVTNTGTNMTVGTNAFGYVVDSKTGTDLLLGTATNKLTASLGPDSVYAYSNDKNGYVYSNTDITTTGGKSYGLYTAGKTENYGNIDLTGGNGNVGIYSTGRSSAGLGATNYGTITVGGTDLVAKEYGIGMATGYYNETTGAISNEGLIENRGTINVGKDNSIGMYAVGAGSKAINHAGATIDISGKNATGMYIDQGAEGINYGTIKSTGSAKGIKGVATVNGGYIKNYGTISITSPDGIGIYQDAASALSQKNVPGNVSGTKANVYSATSTDQKYIVTPKGTLLIQNPPKTPRLTINGKEVALTGLDTNVASPTPSYVTAGATTLDLSLPQFADFKNSVSNAQATELGMYVDTSGVNYTHPIEGLSNLVGLDNINLIIGTEASKYTNAKAIEIGSNIIKPYNDAISSLTTTGTTLNINSAGLTWLAQPLQGTSTPIEKLYMIKIPYTFFTSEKDENSYNFLDGLEQRYGVEGLGTRERQIFDKLNGIGKGETELFTQAVDEMKGHQYSNTQQRINATGNTLDKEFKYLRDEWRNPSKQNNKIKAFGTRDEYSTDTAGIIDYRSNAYGVAYVHEDEKVKMGNSIGWYAGAVTNRFKFKDIGHSTEDQTMVKLGVFKTLSPKGDYNGALQWTISGDVFAGVNNMKRRFWVVDDTFEAKSTYHSYGAAIKNELGYDIRMSERTHLRPYGALKMEYGKFNEIKEKTGQMRLEVKGNDYFSVKPEVGMEFKYVQPLAVKTNLTVGLTAAYENEIGKLQEGNQARVGYTTAGWYNLEKEKEDRRGNGKFDLNIGVDNTRFGVTVNAGYDTKGNNVRGGIGFRAIY